MNRIDRLTAILIQLQSKRVVRAQEIADRFEISLRTVYRDVRALEEGGIPIIGEAGIGYSIMDGYRLPPIMFTKEEAIAFLMAEKMVAYSSDKETIEKYQSALFKIKAVLRSSEKELLNDVDDKILVVKSSPYLPDENNRYIQPILTAITERKVLELNYKALTNSELTVRCVEPVGIYLQYNQWYLLAFCRTRKDYRAFRLDRFVGLQILKESFAGRHPSLKEYLTVVSNDYALYTVVIEIDKMIARYIDTQKYYYGFVSQIENENTFEMTFLSASLDAFARWYLMIAKNATIISPDGLKEKVKALISELYYKEFI